MKLFTKEACRENVVASFFSLKIFIVPLLQLIQHCSTRKSTCRLPTNNIYRYLNKNGLETHEVMRQRPDPMIGGLVCETLSLVCGEFQIASVGSSSHQSL